MGRGLALFLLITMVLVGTGAAVPLCPSPGLEEVPHRDVLRLHILAHSDARKDQELKLAVRDAVLSALTPELRTVTSAVEACRLVDQELAQVAGAAREELLRRGQDQPVTVRLQDSHFPTRVYGGMTYPAGEYKALQIIIGEGLGKNWWCVLFPPLCLVDGTTAKAAEGAEGKEESAPPAPELRFKIVEWFRSLTGE